MKKLLTLLLLPSLCFAQGQGVSMRATNGIAHYPTLYNATFSPAVGDVTAPGLAAGSYPIGEQSLRGFLRFSSTNTAFIDGGATNAITVVSNASGWASIAFSGAGAVARGFDGNYYSTTNPLSYTNGTDKGFWITPPLGVGGTIIVTNAAHPDAPGNGEDAAGVTIASTIFPVVDDTDWLDNFTDFTPITVVSTEGALTYVASHGKFHGDGSALGGIVIYNGTQITNVNATNIFHPVEGFARVNDYFYWTTTNSNPGRIGFSSTGHGSTRGIAVIGGSSGDIVITPSTDGGIAQLGATTRAGNRIYLQKSTFPSAANPDGFSHALEFRFQTWNGGSFLAEDGNPGIVGMSSSQADQKGQLVFYSKVPYWTNGVTSNNQTTPQTAGDEVFRASTNGVVAASGIIFKGNGSGLTNVITTQTTYAAGTAYTLTATPAALDFGTTDPSITITTAGIYLIHANAGLKFNAATYAAAQTATVKLRRTNNTAADLSDGSRALTLPVLTTYTGGDVMTMPPIVYTAAAGDVITLFGSVSATPAAGSITAESAEIVVVKLK